jgi:hypothetical protein
MMAFNPAIVGNVPAENAVQSKSRGYKEQFERP